MHFMSWEFTVSSFKLYAKVQFLCMFALDSVDQFQILHTMEISLSDFNVVRFYSIFIQTPFPVMHVCSESHRSRSKFSRSVPSLVKDTRLEWSWRSENLQQLRARSVKPHFPCLAASDYISTRFQNLHGDYFQSSHALLWFQGWYFNPPKLCV